MTLTEATVFPNAGRSSPGSMRALSIQERVRVRLAACWFTADDLLSLRNPKEKPADDIDRAQSITQNAW